MDSIRVRELKKFDWIVKKQKKPFQYVFLAEDFKPDISKQISKVITEAT